MSRLICFRKCCLLAWLALLLGSQHVLAKEPTARDRAPATHIVQSGEVLSVIAERRGVRLSWLRKVNQLGDADKIRPGQTLLLPRSHHVKAGEVLGTIAEGYGVGLSALYQHNELSDKSVLRVGQRIIIPGGFFDELAESAQDRAASSSVKNRPGKSRAKTRESRSAQTKPEPEYYQHKVRKNEVLSTIAQRYLIPTERVRKINKLGSSSLIRVGQRLKIPISERNLHLTRPEPPKSWHKYARKSFKRGYVTLQSHGQKWSGQAVDKKGAILPEARRRMHQMLAAWRTGKKVSLSPRLLRMIVQVSDEFGGRPIRVVSGYREHSYSRHSRHKVGRALDFSIPGVPNSAIVDYLLTLPDTGVGHYPNSTHVHMDARFHRMYWVDTSGPGQPPRYVHKSTTGTRASASKSRSSVRSRAKARAGDRKRRSSSTKVSRLKVARLNSKRR